MSVCGYEIAKAHEKGELSGWVGTKRPELIKEAFQMLPENYREFIISGASKDTPDKARLWDITRKVLGQDTKNYPQEIGDCVSFGGKNAGEYLTCSEILGKALLAHRTQTGDFAEIIRAARIKFRPVFPPFYYGTGRIYVGGGQMGREDGSSGSWMAEAVRKYGTLFADEPGVPAYSGSVASEWGYRKAPLDKWEPTAKSFLVRTTTLITSWEELCAALANGYPVTTASDVGYDMEAGRDGFHRQTTTWSHQMCFIGFGTKPEPYAVILNNWGDVHGRLKDFDDSSDLPVGVLRVRRADAMKHIRAQETFAYSQFDGFPEQDLAKALFLAI